jgi:hypothetical protein
VFAGALPAAAAPGDIITDLVVPEAQTVYQLGMAKALAMDGKYLYYAEYMGSVMHRIDVPPQGSGLITGHTDIPIVGVPTGVMTFAYDRGRDLLWAVSGDGSIIYTITKGGMATQRFTIDTQNGLPGNCKSSCGFEVKMAYDGSDDTIWYAPDNTQRIYHFATTGNAMGKGVLVAATPYVDVDVAPNSFSPECAGSAVSGIATGGSGLFIAAQNCKYYFEFSKTGSKVGGTARPFHTFGGLSCDNVSYTVSVIWMRYGWNGHIYAFEQPRANACVYGG